MSNTSVIVFADIAGSTALYEVLGNARATEAVTHVMHWLGQSVASQGGRVVKTLGDGVLATFDTAPRAVQAMAALMRDHQQHLREWPSEMCLQVRVGVAGGEVVEVDGDCYGDAVNLAARLCERARPGEVWLSASTVKDAEAAQGSANAPGTRFVRLGSLPIRGKAEPITVYGLEWRQDEDPDSQTMLTNLPSTLGTLHSGPMQLQVHWHGEGHVYSAQDMPLLLGRAPQAQVCVPDPRVSREHARIDWRNGAFVLTDLSRFGTWVRFEGFEPVLLRRDTCLLHGAGQVALGVAFSDDSAPALAFTVSDAGVMVQ